MTSLLRSTRTMAVGTIASRGTGFLRTAVLAAVLGVAKVGDAFNLANTAPNIVYELLLGGVLTSVVVPLLVRAAKDPGAGDAYTQRLLTLVVLVLTAASLLLVVFAPAVVDVYVRDGTDPAKRDLAVVLARFFLPQVLFYGAGAVMGAYLNVRGRFGPPMWAPVLNNVVVILTGLVFRLLPRPDTLAPGTLSDTQITVLGVGVTLGIVAQTAALVPALRAEGFRFVPRLDLRGSGLSEAGRLAKWVFLYVLANQLAYVVVTRLGNSAGDASPGRGYSAYVYAFALWQLPHAVVAVSVITALLPRMSRAAADGRPSEVGAALTGGLRLVLALVVPAAAAYLVLGRSIATVVFAHGEVSVGQARFIGALLGVFALGLVPYSVYQVQLRAFYAMQDTRTPTLVNLAVNASLVVVDVVLYAVLPADVKVVGLAAGQSLSFVVGLAVVVRVLGPRLGGLGGSSVLRFAVRCLAACLPPALAALLAGRLVAGTLGTGLVGALVTVAVGGAVLAAGYVALARRLHLEEVEQALRPVLARLGRSRPVPVVAARRPADADSTAARPAPAEFTGKAEFTGEVVGEVTAALPTLAGEAPPAEGLRPAPGRPGPEPAEPGEVLARRYRLEERLCGAGGSVGSAWRARDEVLARPVGVRLLAARDARSSGLLEAAASAGSVDDRTLARVFDAAVEPRRERPSLAYAVREWVDGEPLRTVLDRAPLAPRVAVELTEQAARALADAHELGVVHGRLHPGNAFLTADGRLRLTDAGTAPAGGPDREAADVRDLAALLYAMLTGTWPGAGTAQPSAGLPVGPVDGGRARGPRHLQPGVPPDLDRVVCSALDPQTGHGLLPGTDPDPDTAEGLLTALRTVSFADGPARPEPPGARPRRRTGAAVVAAVLAVVAVVGVLGAGAGLLLRAREDPAGTPPARARPGAPTGAPAAPDQPVLLAAGAVRDYDPHGRPPRERPDQVPAAHDGDETTAWTTDRYRSATYGGLKPGVGLLVDLGSPVALTSIDVDLAAAGTGLELRAADVPGPDETALPVVARADAAGGASGAAAHLTVPPGTSARYWLVWVTRLAPDRSGFRAGVRELHLHRAAATPSPGPGR